MKLSSFLDYSTIYIQCHDNPDADAIASGFALYTYFTEKGKKVHLIYSGKFKIQKSNLKIMIEKLKIPIIYVNVSELKIGENDLLITVDCQYGAGNVTTFLTSHLAVIDHHQAEGEADQNVLILSNYGSCSTIIWQLLLDSDMDVNNYPDLATALYYGLYTDTLQFSEIFHPMDKDMRDSLQFNRNLILLLRNSNLSASELEIAGIAIIRTIYNDVNHYSLIKSQPCDPNILGLISDMCIQVENVDMCVVYNELEDGIKFSVRSCVKETKASDLAIFLAANIGSGGGHLDKAGGFISKKKYEEHYHGYHTEAYFSEKIQQYCESFDIIYAREFDINTINMKQYKKRQIPIGYAIPTDILPIGTPVTIRTLEGDVDTSIAENMYFMVGIQGEVYINNKEKFNRSYHFSNDLYHLDVSYHPTIKNRLDGSMIALDKYIHSCISTGEVFIMARPLTKAVKVFTQWYEEKYMLGNIGDYIAVRSDDPHDIYVIEKDIFKKTYEEC